jgi:uncharacterized protein (DUF924 family)
MTDIATLEDVLTFWFGEQTGPWSVEPERQRRWFVKDPDFDAAIAARFGSTLETALRGELDHWSTSPRGRLALIVTLDQFPRNTRRGTAGMFSGDARALALATEGLALGHDAALRPIERVFHYLPFEHDEVLASQDRSMALYEALAAESVSAPFATMTVDYAKKHRDVIARFGRFPHRNALLGRPSTDAEREYLAQPGAGF